MVIGVYEERAGSHIEKETRGVVEIKAAGDCERKKE